jgi:hypothetical protein
MAGFKAVTLGGYAASAACLVKHTCIITADGNANSFHLEAARKNLLKNLN